MTRWESLYLYSCAALVAFTCVAYELLLGSYATFLLGASVFQYSLVISLMMLSMGLGSLLARPLSKNNFETFFIVETSLAWCAILAVPAMYLSFCLNFAPSIILILFVSILGVGIGLEIPLLSQMNPSTHSLTKILFSDYAGGFIGGLAFPILLLPRFGFFRLGASLGLLNGIISLIFALTFRRQLRSKAWIGISVAVLTVVFCILEIYFAEAIRMAMESRFFGISEK